MVEIRIENCPFCGSNEMGWGYQSAQGAVMTGKSGYAGSKVEHLICTECGSIVHSRVAKPELFKNIAKDRTKDRTKDKAKPRIRRRKVTKANEASTDVATMDK